MATGLGNARHCHGNPGSPPLTGMVVEVSGHEGHIAVPRLADGLAVVEALEDGHEPGVLLDVAGHGVEVAGPDVARETAPGVVRRTGGPHGQIHVLLGTYRTTKKADTSFNRCI